MDDKYQRDAKSQIGYRKNKKPHMIVIPFDCREDRIGRNLGRLMANLVEIGVIVSLFITQPQA